MLPNGLRLIEDPLRAMGACYCNGITCRVTLFCDRCIDLASECIDHSSAESIGLRDGVAFVDWTVALVGHAD